MKILLCVGAGQCCDGKAAVSLSMEARSKDNEASNAEGGSAHEGFRLQKDPLRKVNHAGILSGSNGLTGRSDLWCTVVLSK